MQLAAITKHFDLEHEDQLDELQRLLHQLDNISHSFFAVNWYSSQQFLWVSDSAKSITGHAMQLWENMGILFILSLTPKELLPSITEGLKKGVAPIEKDITKISEPVIMHVHGGITDIKGRLLELNCFTLFLDYKPGPERTYLVLTVYVSNRHAGDQLDKICRKVEALQKKIHALYVRMKPERFQILRSFSQLTRREKEVTDLIRQGLNSKKIGEQLNISTNTVISHRKNILRKLKINNTAGLVQHMNQVFD
jgi:DNA-binding CsgD family transcriptional regulator